jgi:hypothetical protein
MARPEVTGRNPAAHSPSFEPLLVSISDGQRLLGISRGTINNLMAEGVIRSSKIGYRHMLRYEDIKRIAEEGTNTRASRHGLDTLNQPKQVVTPTRRRRRQFQDMQPIALR